MNIAEYFEVAGPRGYYRPIGETSLHEAARWVLAAIRHAREIGLAELIIDARGVTGFESPGVFDRYDLIKQWFAAAAGQVRLAIVVRPEMIDEQKFGVTVAENRGYKTDVFTTEEAAAEWLDERRSS